VESVDDLKQCFAAKDNGCKSKAKSSTARTSDQKEPVGYEQAGCAVIKVNIQL
jgi:hypothetical protein